MAGTIWWDAFDTPLGPFYAAVSQHGVCRTSIGSSFETFAAPYSAGDFIRDAVKLVDVHEQVAAYFAGRCTDFDLRLDLAELTHFQQQVMGLVLQIPAGTTQTYGAIACALGRPGAARAVGAANAHNPLPLIVPCHRLVGSDGSLRGYGSGDGLPTKRWLLAFEGALDDE